nr:alpha/beta hydrolase [Acidobacteriota bacterium]
MERIAIVVDGREVSHLAVRLDVPEGGGRPSLCLLYLHGFGSNQRGEKAEFFRRQALAGGFAFCSLDFQGHGDSGGTMRGLTLSRNLADIERAREFLEARGHPRISIIGSSMGGGSGLWYSARHPGRVLAGLYIAPALALERSLLAAVGPERARLWQETGAIAFRTPSVDCELGWELIED